MDFYEPPTSQSYVLQVKPSLVEKPSKELKEPVFLLFPRLLLSPKELLFLLFPGLLVPVPEAPLAEELSVPEVFTTTLSTFWCGAQLLQEESASYASYLAGCCSCSEEKKVTESPDVSSRRPSPVRAEDRLREGDLRACAAERRRQLLKLRRTTLYRAEAVPGLAGAVLVLVAGPTFTYTKVADNPAPAEAQKTQQNKTNNKNRSPEDPVVLSIAEPFVQKKRRAVKTPLVITAGRLRFEGVRTGLPSAAGPKGTRKPRPLQFLFGRSF